MTRCGDPESARPGRASKFGDWLDPDADEAWRAANQEALDLGHTWVGTEHMLLGLLRLPSGDPAAAMLAVQGVTIDQFRDAISRDIGDAPRLDATAMLAALGVDLDAVRASVEANFGPDAIEALYARRRRDGHRLARGPLCGMALAPRAKQALEHARRAAKTEHRQVASTSDLLGGLLAFDDGMAVRLLRKLDVDLVALRHQLRPRAVVAGR
jgi:ATP-dependent Clp protease ATP-binding subunit ClpA